MKRGIFIGRFQPFHNGHLSVIRQSLQEVDHLLIGVGSSQESHTKKNPFSFEERQEMIQAALKEERKDKCAIVPVPDCPDDAEWMQYIMANYSPFDISYISKNAWTESCFRKKDCKIHTTQFMEGISGTIIRDAIRHNRGWEHMVPVSVHDYLIKGKGIERIRSLEE